MLRGAQKQEGGHIHGRYGEHHERHAAQPERDPRFPAGCRLLPRTQRVQRALDAAAVSVQAGAFDSAGALLAIARYGPLDEMQRARIDLVSAQMAFAFSRGGEATAL